MTNKQYKLCQIIEKEKNLDKILEKSKVGDYMDLQFAFRSGSLDFSNDKMDKSTIVSLSNDILEEYEDRNRNVVSQRFNLFLSIIAILISIIALFRP